MDSLSKISKNFQIIQYDSDPLDELPISNPLNWDARTVYEFNNPDEYYKEILEEGLDEDYDNE